MRQNEAVTVAGSRVVLVPYCPYHVHRYHQWMQSEELLELTASEPLSLEKEYEMQKSWRTDDDKCTFIVTQIPATAAPSSGEDTECAVAVEIKEVAATAATSSGWEDMVGDVNLFINDPDDPHAAEIDIMVAEPAARGKGIGKEAVLLMLHWGATKLGMTKFVAKIGFANKASAGLFGRLGFKVVSECHTFEETTFELVLDADAATGGGKFGALMDGLTPAYGWYDEPAAKAAAEAAEATTRS